MLTCMMNSQSSKAVDIPRQLMFCSNFPSSGCLFLYNKTWNLLGDKTLQNHRRYFVFSYLSGKLSPKSKPRTHAHRECSKKRCKIAKLLHDLERFQNSSSDTAQYSRFHVQIYTSKSDTWNRCQDNKRHTSPYGICFYKNM